MNIYISGISGTGMGPLALMAKQAGLNVCGSDLAKGAVYDELTKSGIEVSIGAQDGDFLKEKIKQGIDWFVYTSALPADHAELCLAQGSGIKCTKRDDFTAFLVDKLDLKMVAVAGTHGKTTTTSMIIWAALQLKLPAAYIVGTTLRFAPSGAYHQGDKYFIYEADEYDRNFLKYHPWLAVIPAISYDHPDIYPTQQDYSAAFAQFKSQSEQVLEYKHGKIVHTGNTSIIYTPEHFQLAGEARKIDAALAANAIANMLSAEPSKDEAHRDNSAYLVDIMNKFPGVGRRFEKISDSVYTDYAHHPEEISATINIALEQAKLDGKKGVVVVYQPHQNTRQHEVKFAYFQAFSGAEHIYWLPTYLTREDPSLVVLEPADLIAELYNKSSAEPAQLDSTLSHNLHKYLDDGYLLLLMTAGPRGCLVAQKF